MIRTLFDKMGRLGNRNAGGDQTIELVRRLRSAERKSRLFVAGDLHGTYNALMSALHALDFDFEHDLLLLTGDMHDRGTGSAECLEMLKEPWLFSTLGNHELMLLSAVDAAGRIDTANRSAFDLWMANGGRWALDEEAGSLACWKEQLAGLPLYWLLERRDGQMVMVCHAEPSPLLLRDVLVVNSRRIDVADLDDEQTLWGRNMLYTAARPDLDQDIKRQLLSGLADVSYSLHGHSYVRTASWVNNLLFMDTGTVLGNKLTLVDIDQAVPGQTSGIYAWDIAGKRLLEHHATTLWP